MPLIEAPVASVMFLNSRLLPAEMCEHSRLRVDEVKLSVFVRVPETISFPEDASVIFESIVKSPVSFSVPSTVIEEPVSKIRFETSSIVTLFPLAITGWFVTGGIVIILD